MPNDANKYVVGSYTPGLVTNSDGSVSIFMFATQPPGVPEANWLPVPKGPFNVMLRDYGPAGSVVDNTYVPPPVMRRWTIHELEDVFAVSCGLCPHSAFCRRSGAFYLGPPANSEGKNHR